MEAFIYSEMVKKLREFQTLTKHNKSAGNPKVTALKVELARVDAEIEKLLDTLMGASDILISYANTKIADLDSRKQSVLKELADLAAGEVSPERMLRISEFLDEWDSADTPEKRDVIDSLITRVNATQENVDMEWKI
jgi:hypothetical protein